MRSRAKTTIIAALTLTPVTAACSATRHSPETRSFAVEPSWEDVFVPTPPVLLTFRPRALQSDPLYGPLLRRALALVRLRSPSGAATRSLDAIEDAESVVCELRAGAGDALERGDVAVAIRGVHADVDPAALVDDAGRILWTPGPPGRVRELIRVPPPGAEPSRQDESLSPEASLFELPARTWVIASGGEAARARDAFAHPHARVPFPVNLDALAALRVDGAFLAARAPFLRRSGPLAPLGQHLKHVAVALQPGGAAQARAVEATFEYADAFAASGAEATIREVVGAMSRKGDTLGEGLAWVRALRLEPRAPGTSSTEVTLSTPLPTALMAALESVGGAVPPPPAQSAPIR